MSALLKLPRSAYPDWWQPCRGYTSLQHLQQEMLQRHKRNHPPRFFDPAWMIEPTICNKIADGVELWKWSNTHQKWQLDAVIVWKEEN
jgi:hypothetical protein